MYQITSKHDIINHKVSHNVTIYGNGYCGQPKCVWDGGHIVITYKYTAKGFPCPHIHNLRDDDDSFSHDVHVYLVGKWFL